MLMFRFTCTTTYITHGREGKPPESIIASLVGLSMELFSDINIDPISHYEGGSPHIRLTHMTAGSIDVRWIHDEHISHKAAVTCSSAAAIDSRDSPVGTSLLNHSIGTQRHYTIVKLSTSFTCSLIGGVR